MSITNINASTSSAFNSITSRTSQDRKEFSALGKDLQSAENNYRSAIAGGNEGDIAAAQMDYDKSAQKLKAKVEMNSAISHLINSIIEKIGQIGR